MEIRLSDSFTYKKLIRYVLPCIAMMIMTSIYSIVDGYFVSNIIGKNPFAAVNLVMPVLMAISAIGFMIGTGGSALTSYYMGLGEKKKANEVFSMLVWLIIISSCIVAVIGFVFMPQIVELLGASDTIRSDAILRKNTHSVRAVFYASEQFSEFSYNGRETKPWSAGFSTCGYHQHGT